MANLFTSPIVKSFHSLPYDLVQSQLTLDSNRKITRILWSKPCIDGKVNPSYLFDVYFKLDDAKRVNFLSLHTFLGFNPSNWTFSLPSFRGRTNTYFIDYILPAVSDYSFYSIFRYENDNLYADLESIFHIHSAPAKPFDSFNLSAIYI